MALRNNHKVTIDPASPAWDYALGSWAKIELDRDVTLPDLSSVVDPCSGVLVVTQDETGGWILTLPGRISQNFELDLEPGGLTLLGFVYDDNGFLWTGERIKPVVTIPALNAPESFTATVVADDEIDLTWTDTNTSPNETSIKIYKNTVNTFGSATLIATKSSDAVSHNVTGLTPGTLYYFWVKAIGDGTTTLDSTAATTSETTTGSVYDFFSEGWLTLHDPEQDITTVVSGSDLLVSNLKDQKDIGNSARDLVQGTSALRPKLIAGAVNGHDVMHFDTTNSKIATSASLTLTKPFTRIAYVQFKALSGLGYALGSLSVGYENDLGVYDSGGGYRMYMYSGNILYEETAVDRVTINTSYIIQMDFAGDGVNDKLWANGVLQATGNAGSNNPLLAVVLGLGAGSTANCYVGIHALHQGILDSTQRTNATNFLKTYYGIS
jgi:hypothetical protein